MAHAQALMEFLFHLECDGPGSEAFPASREDNDDEASSSPADDPLPKDIGMILGRLLDTVRTQAKRAAEMHLLPEHQAAFLAAVEDHLHSAHATVSQRCGRVGDEYDDMLIAEPEAYTRTVLLDALRTRIPNPSPDSAREWNNAHDRMRTLPPELWGPCLSYLDQTDRCRLLLVCSFWRDRLLGLPELWSTLDIQRIDSSCEDLMRRSSELPLDLTVVISSAKDLEHLDAALKGHIHRAHSLSFVIQCTDYSMTLASRAAFRYSAASLTSLSFVAHGGEGAAFRISKHLFDGDAPRLHAVHFCNVTLPSQCPAFRSATTLSVEGNTGDFAALFDVFPALTTLDIRDPNRRTVLPPIPAGALLRTVELGFAESSRWRMTPMQLSENGYFYLDHFTIHIQNGVEELLEALNLATEDGSSCALTISGRLDVELITDTANGRSLRFSTSLSAKADAGTVLGQPDFPLRELTLPNRLLIQLAGHFELPRLEILTVVCAEPTPPPLLTIAAPLLRRVEFVAGANGRGVSCCYPGTPETRNAFIRRCFQIDNTGAIDVRADPADPPAPQELRADLADSPDEAHAGPAALPDEVPAGHSDSTNEGLRRYVRNRLSPNAALSPADEAVVLQALGDVLTLGRVHRSKPASLNSTRSWL